MEALKARIKELFDRNLVLSQEIREEVYLKLPTLSENQLTTIVQILEQVDEKQTTALTNILEKNPYFFNRVENEILKAMKKEFQKIEAVTHKDADKNLLLDLSNF